MSIKIRNATERLIAEQAVLGYRQVVRAAQEAEHGQGMKRMEQAMLSAGREQMRLTLEHAASAHCEAQKGGSVPGLVRVVASSGSSVTAVRST